MTAVPEVTTLITAYDAVPTIVEAVRSALDQEGVAGEVVVVLDGDPAPGAPGGVAESARLLAELADERVRVVIPGRVGRSRALNAGLEQARSDLLAILDADDLALPGRLRRQRDYLADHPDCAAVGGQLIAFGTTVEEAPHRVSFPVTPAEIDARLQRGRMPLAHPATMFRTAWMREHHGYDESLTKGEDFDLVLRGWAPGRYAAVPEPLSMYRLATPFPTWRYWRAEEISRRAVVRRWSTGRTGPVDLRDGTGPKALLSDAVRWSGQAALLTARQGLTSIRHGNRPSPRPR